MNSPNPQPTGILGFIPGLSLFKALDLAQNRTELIIAVTVFAVLVPSAKAYGDLAGVTSVAGIIVALGAMVMYALFGTSKLLIMGPKATTAILASLRDLLLVTGLIKRSGADNIYPPVRAAVTAYCQSLISN